MEIAGLNIPLWAVILTIFIIVVYSYFTRNYGIFKKMGVPGPSPWFLVGNIHTPLRKGFIESYEEWFRKYGRVFGHFEGSHPLLVVGDVDMLREVTVKEFGTFTNRRGLGIAEIADPPIKDFMTVLEDDNWRHNRNTLTPSFSGGKLKKMITVIKEAGDAFVRALKAKADSGEPLDMKQHTGAYTMDVIAATAFGIKLDSQTTPNDPFIKYAKKFFDFSLFSVSFMILFFVPFLTPLIKILKIPISPKDSMEFFTKVVQQALEERRQNPGKYSDFLQLMLNAEKEAQTINDENGSIANGNQDETHWKDKRKGQGLTDSEILAAAIFFFTAGYDPTATSLAHLFYHLALNPDHMDRLISEIDQHYPDGQVPEYEDLSKLPYLEMVIQEALRMNPPIGRAERVSSRDITINGVDIPAGMAVGLPIYMIHHDPGYWTDPETFNPERFTAENKEKLHPLQWIPFGFGPRNCIGMRLALFEMKLIVVQLLQKYRFVPNSKTAPLKFGDTSLFSNAKNGIWLTAEHRS